jgi:hypothetical protein
MIVTAQISSDNGSYSRNASDPQSTAVGSMAKGVTMDNCP